MSGTLGKEFKGWMQVLTICTSAASLISAIQKLFDIGLTPYFFEFISYYRRLFYPVVEYFPKLFHIALYDWYKDLYILSFILCSITFRASAHFLEERRDERLNIPGAKSALVLSTIIGSALLSIILGGLLVVFYFIPVVASRLKGGNVLPELNKRFISGYGKRDIITADEQLEIGKKTARGIVIVSIVTLVFFSANAFFS